MLMFFITVSMQETRGEEVRRFPLSAVVCTEPVQPISQGNMLRLVAWKSDWQSFSHRSPLHGCGAVTPAHTYPIYPAAGREYQTACVSIQLSGSTFACGESFYFS